MSYHVDAGNGAGVLSEEQPVLLTTEPSLQSQAQGIFDRYPVCFICWRTFLRPIFQGADPPHFRALPRRSAKLECQHHREREASGFTLNCTIHRRSQANTWWEQPVLHPGLHSTAKQLRKGPLCLTLLFFFFEYTWLHRKSGYFIVP